MEEILLTIVKALVDDPDAVSVTSHVEEDETLVLTLNVADDDKGRVIGKQGKIASAVRSVMKAAASQSGKKVVVKIV